VFNLDKSLREMAADPRFWFGIARYTLRQRLGRTVVPGGFDEREDPPGTDFTGYTGPANAPSAGARRGDDLVET
jgi:hypothetical protein